MKKRLLALMLCLITLLTMVPVSAGAEELPLEITTQPENCSAKAGNSFSVSVAAAGEGLTYQWFYADKGEEFQDAGVTEPTYTATMTEAMDGRK